MHASHHRLFSETPVFQGAAGLIPRLLEISCLQPPRELSFLGLAESGILTLEDAEQRCLQSGVPGLRQDLLPDDQVLRRFQQANTFREEHMRIPLRFALTISTLLLLNISGLLWIRHELLSRQDGTPDLVRVVQALPDSNVDTAERLAILFDQDLGEPALLNDAVSNAVPFQLSPEVPGRWEWTSARRLEYVLEDPLPPGRTFVARPAAGLEDQLGRIIQVDSEIEYRTRRLQLTDCRMVSSDRRELTFELVFNQKVSPEELISHLRLEPQTADENRTETELTVHAVVNEPDQSIVLRCRRPKSGHLRLRIDETLCGVDGDRPLGQETTRTLKIAAAFSFLRTEIRERSQGTWQIDLLFSSGLDPEQKQPAITTTPEVENQTVTLAHSWRVRGHVLRLQGPFESGRRYRVSLPPHLLSQAGKPLGETAEVTFRIPDRRPDVTIPQGNGILSQHGNLEVEVATVNVSGLRVNASRVHANNLVAHLQGNGQHQTSRILEARTVPITAIPNQAVTQVLSLNSLLKEPLGVYRLSVSATDRAWTRDSALVAVTDLGLTMKQSGAECLIWVTSLRSARPVTGVRVAAVSYNNQTLSEGHTDEYGLVRLPVDALHPDGRPWVFIAEHGGQTAWLKADSGHAVLDDVDQSGRQYPDEYDVMLYSERGTYRPGETIHLTGMIRDSQGRVPRPFPLALHMIRPDGQTAQTLTVTPGQSALTEKTQSPATELLAANGTFHQTFQPSESAWTGTWRFQVTLPGSDRVLGNTQVFVEEFVPVRLEVSAIPLEPLATGTAVPSITVTSRYLFGQPASGLITRVRTGYSARRFQSADQSQYTFGPRQLPGRKMSEEVQVALDAAGRAKIPLPLKTQITGGPWQADSSVTVTEDGGRSVSAQTRCLVDRSARHIGLLLTDSSAPGEPVKVVATDSELTLDWIIRDARDQPATAAKLELELLRVQFDYVARRVNGRVIRESLERVESIWQRTLDRPADAVAGQLTLSCAVPGTYRLVTHDGDGSRTELQFQAVSPGGRGLTGAMNRPEQLQIQLDKPIYRPGDTAQAMITSPFPGTALICLESNRVISSQTVEFTETSARVAIAVPQSLRGGAFVSATLLRPVNPEEKTWLPHRARGLVRLKTDHNGHRLPVEIKARAIADPQDSIPLAVSTAPGAMIHLWAVDEGILATSGFQLPDPLNHFFAERRNDVVSSDVFSMLLTDHQRPASLQRIGGDAGVAPLRRNPVPSRKATPVVIWNGFFQADAAGHLETTARLQQQFTGRLRWMAVAVHGDRYGSAQHELQMTQPLLVETSWPRYVSVGDVFSVPVKLINTTNQIIQLQPESATTALTPEDDPGEQFTVRIPPRGTSLIWQQFRAAEVSGTGSASLDLQAQFEDPETGATTGSYTTAAWCRLGYDIELPIRPVTVVQTERQILSLDAGQKTEIVIDPGLLPVQGRTRLSFSSSAESDLEPVFESLLDYPYGCVEQTSSRLRSLIAAAQSLPAERAAAIRPLVTAGISRLWSLQIRSGGLSYWPGQQTAAVWGTAYATETLLKTRDAGYQIDPRLLNRLQVFLERELNNSSRSDPGTQAAICCCLSQLGSPPTGWMSVLSERLNELDMAGRARLARAWWHAGRREAALAAIPGDTLDLDSPHSYGQRPNSDVTGQALLLTALTELDARQAWLPVLMQRIQAARRNGLWSSTLENALALEGLMAARKADRNQTPFTGTVMFADQQIDLDHGVSRDLILKEPLAAFTVQPQGSGRLSVCIQTTSLSRSGPEEVDHLIQVRRNWRDRDGRSIDPGQIRPGDLLIAEVRLRSLGPQPVQNVAIVDPLPGGLEIENPRLRTSDQSLKSESADHVQFLDDRIVLFATARPVESVFRYALRAVSAGTFAVPPIQASCMYNESITSIHGTGQQILIVPDHAEHSQSPLAVKPGDGQTRQK